MVVGIRYFIGGTLGTTGPDVGEADHIAIAIGRGGDARSWLTRT